METAAYCPGRIVWHEIFTPDIDKSKAFYSELCGWSYIQSEAGEMKYDMIQAGDIPVGGLMPLETVKMPGVPPFWMAYVSVPDVNEAAAAAKQGGGKVLVDPTDIPTVGSFSVIMDPQGAVISAWKGLKGDPPEIEQPPVGTFCWDQLNTPDPDGAAAFYAKVLGWTMAPYQGNQDMPVFSRGELPAAGLMPSPAGVPPHWLNFVVVQKLADARAKAEKLGAKVMLEEMAVPGIGKFAVIMDNVGAGIAIFEGGE